MHQRELLAIGQAHVRAVDASCLFLVDQEQMAVAGLSGNVTCCRISIYPSVPGMSAGQSPNIRKAPCEQSTHGEAAIAALASPEVPESRMFGMAQVGDLRYDVRLLPSVKRNWSAWCDAGSRSAAILRALEEPRRAGRQFMRCGPSDKMVDQPIAPAFTSSPARVAPPLVASVRTKKIRFVCACTPDLG